MDIYNVMYKCELLFRKNESNLITNKLKATDFIEICLQTYPTNFIPSCHNIVFKLVKKFVTARIHFSLKRENNTNNSTKANAYSSRSVSMRAVTNVKHFK